MQSIVCGRSKVKALSDKQFSKQPSTRLGSTLTIDNGGRNAVCTHLEKAFDDITIFNALIQEAFFIDARTV